MTPRIAEIRPSHDSLEVAWQGRREKSRFLKLWLRDHCGCPECLHPETKQRQVDSFALPAAPEVAHHQLVDGGAALDVIWAADGHASRYDAAFLADLTGAAEAPEIETWDRAALDNAPPSVAHAAAMQSAAGLKDWLEKIERFGFCFVEGVPPTAEATQALAERIAYIRHTLFGGFWDFTANMEHKDTAYTTLSIGPHSDGTYSFDAPGYQMFHCLEFDGEGGESTLVDGFRIAEILQRDAPEAYETLARVRIPGHYLDEGVNLRAARPLFREDAHGRLRQVSYNNHDRAPFWLPEDEMAAFYKALKAFDALANDPALVYRRRLEPGTALLFDNWRVLHGRLAYQGHRRLAGAYLNKEDVESRLRVLRQAP
ncbi:MAG: trimethyllysine dioxygenase [Rhodovibrionaceae bacterium]